jgi:hypothetical protein
MGGSNEGSGAAKSFFETINFTYTTTVYKNAADIRLLFR